MRVSMLFFFLRWRRTWRSRWRRSHPHRRRHARRHSSRRWWHTRRHATWRRHTSPDRAAGGVRHASSRRDANTRTSERRWNSPSWACSLAARSFLLRRRAFNRYRHHLHGKMDTHTYRDTHSIVIVIHIAPFYSAFGSLSLSLFQEWK